MKYFYVTIIFKYIQFFKIMSQSRTPSRGSSPIPTSLPPNDTYVNEDKPLSFYLWIYFSLFVFGLIFLFFKSTTPYLSIFASILSLIALFFNIKGDYLVKERYGQKFLILYWVTPVCLMTIGIIFIPLAVIANKNNTDK